MVLLLLLLFWNDDNLIVKPHKKVATLMKGGFKIGSVPGLINKELLTQFMHKPTQSSEKLFI